MTKICGILDFSRKDLKDLAKSMSDSMKHERWHKSDVISQENVGLGNVSIEKDTKNQVIWSKDKTQCMLFSGIVYDADVKEILKSFEKKNFVKNLNGIFAFAIFDFKKRKLTLVNDRYGFRPLYYYVDKDKVVFGSEIKSIIKDKDIKREIDWKAWGDFIYFGEIHGNNTFFKNISALPSASILTFEKGKTNIEKYWDYNQIKIDNKHPSWYFVKKGAVLIHQAVERQTKDLKEADCFLTGGYDSRSIAMTIAQQGKVKLDTFTTRKEGDGYKDRDYAKKVADYLKFNNKFVDLPNDLYQKHFLKTFYLTDGMANEHLFLMPAIEKIDDKSVNFDGIVGDILLRGSFANEDKLKYGKKLMKTVMNRNKAKIIKKIFNKKIAKEINKSAVESVDANLKALKDYPNFLTLFYLTNEGRRKVALSAMSTILTKKESRMPFLDNDFVGLALSIPTDKKVHDDIYTKVLKNIDAECMKLPSTRGDSSKKTSIFSLSRLTFIRKLRNKIFFMITTSPFLLGIVDKLGVYKKYSAANLEFERKVFEEYPDIEGILKKASHDRDIYSKYRLHFKLWYYTFFKS